MADDDFESLDCTAHKEVLAKIKSLGLKEERFRVTPVPSLHHLSAQAIITKADYFLRKPENSFKNLPDCLAQKLIQLCTFELQPTDEIRKFSKEPFTSEQDKKARLVLLLLQNPNLQSFNIIKLLRFRQRTADYLVEVLKNCPNLQHFTAAFPTVPTTADLGSRYITMVVRDLPMLRTLSLTGFFVGDTAMKLVQEKLPHLEKICLCIDTEIFTKVGLESLKKMHKLTDLELVLHKYDVKGNQPFLLRVAIEACSALSKLQRLHLDMHSKSTAMYQHFAFWFAKKVSPSRKVTLRYVDTSDRLLTKFVWPQNLSVEELFVEDGIFKEEDHLENMCSIPVGVTKLTVTNLQRPQALYKLLERFGPVLKTLRLGVLPCALKPYPSPLNLYKVMSQCPVLEHFSSSCMIPLELEPKHGLTPRYFTNMKSFEIEGECRRMTLSRLTPFLDIFKMVISGSECYEILELQNQVVLHATRDILKRDPHCLKGIKVFNVAIAGDDDLEDAVQIAKMLMLRSPQLHTIEANGIDIGFFPPWFQMLVMHLGVEFKTNEQYCTVLRPYNDVHVFSTSNIPKFDNEDFLMRNGFPCMRYFQHAHSDNDHFLLKRMDPNYAFLPKTTNYDAELEQYEYF